MKKTIIWSILFCFISVYWVYVWAIFPLSSWQINYGNIRLMERTGKVITKKPLPWGLMIPYKWTMTGTILEAIKKIEDKRFDAHHGIDIYGKLWSIRENLRAWETVRGGSTITEQYIKNVYYPWAKRTYLQKIREALWALYIESLYSKEYIFRKYLDTIYFWNRTYGLETILETSYPWKNIEELSEDNILDIITRIKYPNINNTTKYKAILYRELLKKKLWYNSLNKDIQNYEAWQWYDTYPILTEYVKKAKTLYCEWKKDALEKIALSIPWDICNSSSIELHLSIDGDLMNYATQLLENTIRSIEKENVTAGAIYVYDPKKKKILTYIWNRPGQAIDMIQERRSVGSILKPFIYLLALQEWAEIEDFVLDDMRVYPTGIWDKQFIPQNYNPKSYGPVRLREALWNSMNSATVRITETLGLWKVYDFMKECGLDIDHDVGYYGYGISLWNVELSLANIVESYSLFLDTADTNIYLMQQILSNEKNRAKTFGISSILNSSINLPVKTGTSTDFRDNWSVSYHDAAIIGVWVGNSDGSPMKDVSGISGAGPIWHNMAEYMIKKGIIHEKRNNLPKWVNESYICMDAQCLRKERTFLKNQNVIKSRPIDKIYYASDFFSIITESEKEKWNIQD